MSTFDPVLVEYFRIKRESQSHFFEEDEDSLFIFNQNENKINKFAFFKENKSINIVLVHNIRSSYHDSESTPFLYEVTYSTEKSCAPEIHLYRFQDQTLKLIFIQSMNEVTKSKDFESYDSFLNTPIHLRLEIFHTNKQSAFALKNGNSGALFTETTIETIKDPLERFLAYLECMFSSASFMSVDSVTHSLAEKLIDPHIESEILKKLSYNPNTFDLLFKYRHKLHMEQGHPQIKVMLEKALLNGFEIGLEKAEHLDDSNSLFILNRNGEKSLHLISKLNSGELQEVKDAFKMLAQTKNLYPDVSFSSIEFIVKDAPTVTLDALESPTDYITFTYMDNNKLHYDTFHSIKGQGFQKLYSLHNLHKYYFETFELFKYKNFTLTKNYSQPDSANLIIHASAKKNAQTQGKIDDLRLIACAFLTKMSFERELDLLCSDIEKTIESIPIEQKPLLNRIILQALKDVEISEANYMDYIEEHHAHLRKLRIEKILIKHTKDGIEQLLEIKNILGDRISTSTVDLERKNRHQLISPASKIEARELQVLSKGGIWAYRIPLLIETLAAEFRKEYFNVSSPSLEVSFIELDLDHSQTVIHPTTGSIDYNFGELIPVHRPPGCNEAGVVIGIKTDDLGLGTPIKRLLIIGDLSHPSRGAIRGQECIRINAAIRYAAREKIPIDWYAASYGVQIHRERGVEGLDAAASTLREIITYSHHNGVPINLIIDEANIGAQSYWDSMAAIVYDTSGILIMTANGCMALTGPKALACALYSTVSSENIAKYTDALYPQGLQSLSGHELVHGPNSDSMLFAKDLEEANKLLLLHHYYSYLNPREIIVSKRRVFKEHQQAAEDKQLLQKEIDNFLKGLKPNRRHLLEYLRDYDSPSPLEFWADSKGNRKQIPKNGDLPQEASTIVQEMLIGGHPTLVIFTPTGPLTPADADIIARAIYKASARQQVLIIGSLSGFSCDPLSMENRQLLEGALIAKAIVEHKGPILICNLGSLVGGTFVVFNKQLHKDLRILAIEGARVQVIGGKSAAKVVFHTSICKLASQDSRLIQATKEPEDPLIQRISQKVVKEKESPLSELRKKVISEIEDKEGLLFDQFHNAQRALKVKSIDQIVSFTNLKESIIHNFEEMRLHYITKDGQRFDTAA